MSIAVSSPRSILVSLFLIILTSCQPTPPTPIAQQTIKVGEITVNNTVTGQIIQTKTFDQCKAASPLYSQVIFAEGSSETTQKELTLSGTVGVEGEIPEVAKVTLEAAIQQRFAMIKERNQSHQESVTINVPAHTRQEYTIIWTETRHEGTIEYTVNDEQQFANYSYRVGLEFKSAEGQDIDCSLPTATPIPTATFIHTSTPASSASTLVVTPTPQTRTILDGCVFSRTWKPDSPDTSLINEIPISQDGCYVMDELGIFANSGALRLSKDTRNTNFAAGIYTPVNSNSVIEFNIYVKTLSMTYDNTAEIIFAVTPINDRLFPKPTARFKLHLEDPGPGKIVHFMMADAGENNGVKLGTQHYEHGRTYNIRFVLSENKMDVFINGYRLNESLDIPVDQKAFYIGYTLPSYTEMDVTISSISIDGLMK